jgi:hypothetical protein
MALRSLVLALAVTLPVMLCGAQQQTAAQSQPVPLPPPQAVSAQKAPAGLEAPWDVKQMLSDVAAQNQRFKPLLNEMKPEQWLANGAPPSYVNQYQQAQARVDDAIRAAGALSFQTDNLPLALDAYFRMEALEYVARSLEQCVRRYGERRQADQLATLIAQDFSHREKLRNYLQNLSTERDQEFKIADQEAQRCRGIISKESPSPHSPGHRRNERQ